MKLFSVFKGANKHPLPITPPSLQESAENGVLDHAEAPELPEAAQELVDYWARARGDAALPCKTEIDPLKLREWIGNVSIIDLHDGPHRFWVRLHGHNVSKYIGTGFERRYLEERIPASLHSVALKPYFVSIEKRLPTFSVLMPGLLTGRFDKLIRLILPFGFEGGADVEQFLVWAGESNRDRFECDTVYGKGYEETPRSSETGENEKGAGLTILRPDRPLPVAR